MQSSEQPHSDAELPSESYEPIRTLGILASPFFIVLCEFLFADGAFESDMELEFSEMRARYARV